MSSNVKVRIAPALDRPADPSRSSPRVRGGQSAAPVRLDPRRERIGMICFRASTPRGPALRSALHRVTAEAAPPRGLARWQSCRRRTACSRGKMPHSSARRDRKSRFSCEGVPPSHRARPLPLYRHVRPTGWIRGGREGSHRSRRRSTTSPDGSTQHGEVARAARIDARDRRHGALRHHEPDARARRVGRDGSIAREEDRERPRARAETADDGVPRGAELEARADIRVEGRLLPLGRERRAARRGAGEETLRQSSMMRHLSAAPGSISGFPRAVGRLRLAHSSTCSDTRKRAPR